MKKTNLITLSTLAVLSVFSTSVFADGHHKHGGYNGKAEHRGEYHKGEYHKGGFVNSSQPVSSVSKESSWKDDQFVVLQGKIVEQVGRDDFRFKDASGELIIEIDRKAWRGQEINPNDEVKLFGEVDKSWNKTEVEIHRVEKVK